MKNISKWLAATIALSTVLSPVPAWAAATGEAVTRMEAARAFSKTMALPFLSQETSAFADVAVGEEGWQHIAAVKEVGLMNGDGTGSFYPNKAITREQMAVLMVKSFGLAPVPHDRLELDDSSTVSEWAKDWVGTALDLGLMQSVDNNFKPLALVTPEELNSDLNNYWNRKFVSQAVAGKLSALAAKDKADFLAQLDPSQKEYLEEQSHWFDDFVSHDIRDFKIHVGRVEKIDERSLVATLKQSYTFADKDYTLEFPERFVFTEKGWRDSDFNFLTKTTDHFDIKYLPGDEQVADKVAHEAELAYENLQKKLPFDNMGKTTVKIYKDLEQLRQSVKMSFTWTFQGWYEFPESIKINSVDGLNTGYVRLIEHESIHKITMTWSNNNLPYWFAEGLATHYTRPSKWRPKSEYTFKSIRDLEKINVETLTEANAVSQYYNDSGMIVRFLIEKYGDDKLKKLLLTLGEYPFQSGTTSDHDPLSKQRFAEAVPKVLGKNLDALDAEWLQWVQTNQQ